MRMRLRRVVGCLALAAATSCGGSAPGTTSPSVDLPLVSSAIALKAPTVTITLTEGVFVEGRRVETYEALRAELRQVGRRTVEPSGTSAVDLAIEADAAAPFLAVAWAMLAAAEAKIYRVHWSVRHRASGTAGVVPLFLPQDRCCPPSVPVARRVRVSHSSRTESVTPEDVYGTAAPSIARGEGSTFVVEVPDPGTRHRTVVGIVDALRAAGATGIYFGGVSALKRDPGDVVPTFRADIERLLAMPAAGVVVSIEGERVASAMRAPLPNGASPDDETARHGAHAGSAVDAPQPEEETEAVAQPDVLAKEPTIKDAEVDGTLPDDPTRPRRKTEDAVDPPSSWLLAHQSADGGWSATHFGRWCDGVLREDAASDGAGAADRDVGVTALAMLSFLDAGYTNRSEGAIGKAVGQASRYLRNAQDADGCFARRDSAAFLDDHAFATLAMVQLYGMTGSVIAKGPAQKALDFLAAARARDGGWSRPRATTADPVLTGWAMLSFASARLIAEADVAAGKAPSLTVDERVFADLRRWVDRATDPATGRVASATRSDAATAIGAYARVILGEDRATSDAIGKAVAICLARPPAWNATDGSIDLERWYFATLLLADGPDDAWKAWKDPMLTALLRSQRPDGDRCELAGSWDPHGPGARESGRVFASALAPQIVGIGRGYVRESDFVRRR